MEGEGGWIKRQESKKKEEESMKLEFSRQLIVLHFGFSAGILDIKKHF